MLYELTKLAFNKELAKSIAGYTAVGVPLALMIGKDIHTEITKREPKEDIHADLKDLESRKERMQAVRTAFENRFNELGLDVVDDEKTKVTVGRSMFPWKDKYNISIELNDHKGEPVSDWDDYYGDIYKDKNGNYVGYVGGIFTKEKMQGKGIGRKVENRMVDSFRDVGATKATLMPAYDGPLVWAKEDFGYSLDPERKKSFLKAYEKYTKKNDLPFEDLGDTPSNYPKDFLKNYGKYSPFFGKAIFYEKPLQKQANELVKLPNDYEERLKKLKERRVPESIKKIQEDLPPGKIKKITDWDKEYGLTAFVNQIQK